MHRKANQLLNNEAVYEILFKELYLCTIKHPHNSKLPYLNKTWMKYEDKHDLRPYKNGYEDVITFYKKPFHEKNCS